MALSRLDLRSLPRSDLQSLPRSDLQSLPRRPAIDGSLFAAGFVRAFDALAAEPWWREGDREPRLEAGAAQFFTGPLGTRLLEAAYANAVEREVAFSLRWPLLSLLELRPDLIRTESLDSRWGPHAWQEALQAAWVLIQGRVDCLFTDGDSRVVIDWKTDRVGAGEERSHAERYRTQMRIYAEAARRLWGAPVEAYLVFLWTGESVRME
jgi:ATP-dependent helicase/nuclease subunit A